MKIENVNLFTPDLCFRKGTVEFTAKIRSVEYTGEEDPNLPYCIPGLIDLHTHGNSGAEFSDASFEGIKKMGNYYASHGITSFAGTTVTLPVKELEQACQNGACYAKEEGIGAHLRGIHLEGPHFSYEKRGAQNPEYLLAPSIDAFEQLSKASEGLLRITDLAPELDGSMEYICFASKKCTVSVAHTECDYETASRAFAAGASLLTHSFNAMAPIKGREPGPIVAAYEQKHVMAELIGDGKHVAPANIRMMYRLFGRDRIVLISDSLRCCGMPEGTYLMGGQQITVKNGLGYLSDGTIAGAANDLFKNLKAVISFGIPKEAAICSATINPARVLRCENQCGTIETGKDADLVLCNNQMELQQVWLDGTEFNG